MTVFSDIHTYLIISFFIMVFLVYKFAYGKGVIFIQSKIDSISNSISSVEKRKEEAEKRLRNVERSVSDVSEKKDLDIKQAQIKADEIITSSNGYVQEILKKKEQEYQKAIEKIKTEISSEIQRRIITFSVSELMRMVNAKKNKQEMHNLAIEKSIEMLEEEARENSALR